jgi:hypothetical protein
MEGCGPNVTSLAAMSGPSGLEAMIGPCAANVPLGQCHVLLFHWIICVVPQHAQPPKTPTSTVNVVVRNVDKVCL